YQVDPRAEDTDLEIAKNAYHAAISALGARHFATLRAEDTLGWDLRWRNRTSDALPYAHEAAVGLKEIVGAEHPTAMFASYNEAVCLFELQRYDEAIAVLKPLAALRNRVLGPLHCDSLCSSWKLAVSLRAIGNTSEAFAVLDGVDQQLQQSPELLSWHAADAIWQLANFYLELQQGDRASELYGIADKTLSAVPEEESGGAAYLSCLGNLAETLITSGNEKVRNVSRGIELATKGCELTDYKNAKCVEMLIT